VEVGIFPESIWDSLAPEVQHQNEKSAREKVIKDDNLQIFCPGDFDHNRQMLLRCFLQIHYTPKNFLTLSVIQSFQNGFIFKPRTAACISICT